VRLQAADNPVRRGSAPPAVVAGVVSAGHGWADATWKTRAGC
jgi:hypothetical protein